MGRFTALDHVGLRQKYDTPSRLKITCITLVLSRATESTTAYTFTPGLRNMIVFSLWHYRHYIEMAFSFLSESVSNKIAWIQTRDLPFDNLPTTELLRLTGLHRATIINW